MLEDMPEVHDTAKCLYTCTIRKYAVYFLQKQKYLP